MGRLLRLASALTGGVGMLLLALAMGLMLPIASADELIPLAAQCSDYGACIVEGDPPSGCDNTNNSCHDVLGCFCNLKHSCNCESQ